MLKLQSFMKSLKGVKRKRRSSSRATEPSTSSVPEQAQPATAKTVTAQASSAEDGSRNSSTTSQTRSHSDRDSGLGSSINSRSALNIGFRPIAEGNETGGGAIHPILQRFQEGVILPKLDRLGTPRASSTKGWDQFREVPPSKAPISPDLRAEIRTLVRRFQGQWGGPLIRNLGSQGLRTGSQAVAVFPRFLRSREDGRLQVLIALQCHPEAEAHVQKFLRTHHTTIHEFFTAWKSAVGERSIPGATLLNLDYQVVAEEVEALSHPCEIHEDDQSQAQFLPPTGHWGLCGRQIDLRKSGAKLDIEKATLGGFVSFSTPYERRKGDRHVPRPVLMITAGHVLLSRSEKGGHQSITYPTQADERPPEAIDLLQGHLALWIRLLGRLLDAWIRIIPLMTIPAIELLARTSYDSNFNLSESHVRYHDEITELRTTLVQVARQTLRTLEPEAISRHLEDMIVRKLLPYNLLSQGRDLWKKVQDTASSGDVGARTVCVLELVKFAKTLQVAYQEIVRDTSWQHSSRDKSPQKIDGMVRVIGDTFVPLINQNQNDVNIDRCRPGNSDLALVRIAVPPSETDVKNCLDSFRMNETTAEDAEAEPQDAALWSQRLGYPDCVISPYPALLSSPFTSEPVELLMMEKLEDENVFVKGPHSQIMPGDSGSWVLQSKDGSSLQAMGQLVAKTFNGTGLVVPMQQITQDLDKALAYIYDGPNQVQALLGRTQFTEMALGRGTFTLAKWNFKDAKGKLEGDWFLAWRLMKVCWHALRRQKSLLGLLGQDWTSDENRWAADLAKMKDLRRSDPTANMSNVLYDCCEYWYARLQTLRGDGVGYDDIKPAFKRLRIDGLNSADPSSSQVSLEHTRSVETGPSSSHHLSTESLFSRDTAGTSPSTFLSAPLINRNDAYTSLPRLAAGLVNRAISPPSMSLYDPPQHHAFSSPIMAAPSMGYSGFAEMPDQGSDEEHRRDRGREIRELE